MGTDEGKRAGSCLNRELGFLIDRIGVFCLGAALAPITVEGLGIMGDVVPILDFTDLAEGFDIQQAANIDPQEAGLHLDILHRPPAVLVSDEADEEWLRETVDMIHAKEVAHAISSLFCIALRQDQQ